MGLWTSKSPSPSVVAVQSILRYEFKKKSLLEQALTHSSYTDSESYERLEFVGDAVIYLAFAKLLFVTYPDLDPGRLSILREENVSGEKLARVAVRRGLYKHMNHSAPDQKLQVEKFVSSIIKEKGYEIFPYGREMKAPKVLSDLVESVAAAVYVDCGFNLELMWKCISPLLEPFVTPKNIEKHPVGMVYELCQKMRKTIDFEFSEKTPKFVCSVMVDRTLVSQSSSDQKKFAKLNAAKKAFPEIAKLNGAKEAFLKMNITEVNIQKHPREILNELCQKMRKKLDFEYSIETSKFVCSVIVDGRLVSQSSSDQKDFAKLNAAMEALPEIAKLNGAKEALLKMNMTGTSSPSMDIDGPLAITEEVEGAKQKLNKCCRIFLLFFCFWVFCSCALHVLGA